MCSDPTAVQCHTAFGNCLLLSAAVQTRLTAGLGHCKYTYGDLLSVQVCSDPTAVQCHTALEQLPPAQCCCAKQADSRLGPLQIHLWTFAVTTGMQWPKTSAVPHCSWQLLPAQCCCAKQADSRLGPLQIHLWTFAVTTGMQWPKTSAVPHCSWQLPLLSAAVQNKLTAGLGHCKYT